jgi:hypothetical protein
MNETRFALLDDRGAFRVEGEDAAGFLQSLLTNNVGALREGEAAFSALLTPQGKILADFFALRRGEGFLIDCPVERREELMKRLSLYRLRSRVRLVDETQDLCVAALWGEAPPSKDAFADPRWPALGWRAILPREADRTAADPAGRASYRSHRIALAIPEGGVDYAYGDAFPHEACLDQLAGVDFRKGCYVGQEIVSRMEHRGTARTRIVAVEGDAPLAPGAAISAGAVPIGRIGSAEGARGVGLVRLDRASEAMERGEPLLAAGAPVTLRRPDWARYEFPVTRLCA